MREHLTPLDRMVLGAFAELSPSRAWTEGGPGALPVSEVAAFYRFDDWPQILPARLFMGRMRMLDNTFLAFHHERRGGGK